MHINTHRYSNANLLKLQSCSRLRHPRYALPTLLPEGERSEGAEGGLFLPLPPGEGGKGEGTSGHC